MGNEIREKLFDLLPKEDCRSGEDLYYLKRLKYYLVNDGRRFTILDYGAGIGKSRQQFRDNLAGYNYSWEGVDIADSPEILSASQAISGITFYDGLILPFENNSYDIVWSHQVLEHLRRPDEGIKEIVRVLRPGGFFLGSVSQLEPYHSKSMFNWTFYGILTVFEDNGLVMRGICPGIDGLTLMLRSVFGYNTFLNKYFTRESPLENLINAFSDEVQPSQIGSKDTLVNRRYELLYQKLLVSGHIHFIAQKPFENV